MYTQYTKFTNSCGKCNNVAIARSVHTTSLKRRHPWRSWTKGFVVSVLLLWEQTCSESAAAVKLLPKPSVDKSEHISEHIGQRQPQVKIIWDKVRLKHGQRTTERCFAPITRINNIAEQCWSFYRLHTKIFGAIVSSTYDIVSTEQYLMSMKCISCVSEICFLASLR